MPNLATEQTDANRNHIVLPLVEFQQAGPNGTHQRLVFEPLGPSVGLLLEGIPDSPGDVGSVGEPPPLSPPPSSAAEAPSTTQLTLGRKKALVKQLLLGLDCLHCGAIAHGDLTLAISVGNPTILEPRRTEHLYIIRE